MSRQARVRMPYVERLATTLSARDWAIVDTIHRLRLVSGGQLERLHFSNLSLHSQSVVRGRALKRLADAHVLMSLERRIGSARRGSDKLSYALDSAGQRLVCLRANAELGRVSRRPRAPGERFFAHALAVSELYVSLMERSRLSRYTLDDFQAEPDAWVSDGIGGWLKPDAFAKLRHGDVSDYWWVEADLATESLPTVRHKLLTYLDFVGRGQLGPDGIVPRVLIGVPTRARLTAVQRIVNALPTPAEYMFRVVELTNAAAFMEHELLNW